MTITDALDTLYQEIDDSERVDLKQFNIWDDEDLIVFALNFLRSNLDDAFDMES